MIESVVYIGILALGVIVIFMIGIFTGIKIAWISCEEIIRSRLATHKRMTDKDEKDKE